MTAEGQERPAEMMFKNDTPPEHIFYQGQDRVPLGREPQGLRTVLCLGCLLANQGCSRSRLRGNRPVTPRLDFAKIGPVKFRPASPSATLLTPSKAPPRLPRGNARVVGYVALGWVATLLVPWLIKGGSAGAVAVVFFSILWESLPFLLVGTILSLVIQETVPQVWLTRLFGGGGPRGLLMASLVGLALPMCECGIVPLVRGLLEKQVRPSVAATAYLSIPLVNPIVIGSTLYAFRDHPEWALLRLGGGWIVVLVIGHLLWAAERWVFPPSTLRQGDSPICSCGHVHGPGSGHPLNWGNHLAADLFSTGRYLVIGALVSAVLSACWGAMKTTQDLPWFAGVALAMGLAFVLSLCSSSDALVGRSLLGTFSGPAVVAFLLVGPLLHLRSLILLRSVFPVRTLVILGVLVAGGVAGLAVAIHWRWTGGLG